jgi:hypothetical protein
MCQSRVQDSIELSSGQVLTMTIDTLIEHFDMVVTKVGPIFKTTEWPKEMKLWR